MEKEYIRRDTLLNGFDREGFEGIKERFERYVSSEMLALYRIRNVGDYKYLLTDLREMEDEGRAVYAYLILTRGEDALGTRTKKLVRKMASVCEIAEGDLPETRVYLSELNEDGKRVFALDWLLPLANRESFPGREEYYSWADDSVLQEEWPV